jgi:hypothetical protein
MSNFSKLSKGDLERLKRDGLIRDYHYKNVGKEKQVTRNKFNAKKCVDEHGNKFDSKREYNRYLDLMFLKKIGEVTVLRRQVVYELSVCKYIADFVYRDKNGIEIVEDVKSAHTRKLPVYRLKKKMMLKELGIEIKEY